MSNNPHPKPKFYFSPQSHRSVNLHDPSDYHTQSLHRPKNGKNGKNVKNGENVKNLENNGVKARQRNATYDLTEITINNHGGTDIFSGSLQNLEYLDRNNRVVRRKSSSSSGVVSGSKEWLNLKNDKTVESSQYRHYKDSLRQAKTVSRLELNKKASQKTSQKEKVTENLDKTKKYSPRDRTKSKDRLKDQEKILRKQLRDNFDSIYNSHESSSSSGIQKNVSSGNETNSIGELPPDPGVSVKLESTNFYEKTSDIIDHAKNRQLGETLQNYQRQLCLLRQRRIRRKLVNGVKVFKSVFFFEFESFFFVL